MDFDTPGETPEPPRQRFTLAKLGWWIGGSGFLLAFCAVAVLGQGATRFEETASTVHSISLLVMLVGMVIAFIGHRVHWIMNRPVAPRAPVAELPVLDAQIVEPNPDEESWQDAADQSPSRKSLAALGFVFCLTVGIAMVEVLLLVMNPPTSLILVGLAILALTAALVIAAYRGTSHLRAFALGALVPSVLMLLLIPVLFHVAFEPVWSGRAAMHQRILAHVAMIGWMLILPAGLFGAIVWEVRRSYFFASANSRSTNATTARIVAPRSP